MLQTGLRTKLNPLTALPATLQFALKSRRTGALLLLCPRCKLPQETAPVQACVLAAMMQGPPFLVAAIVLIVVLTDGWTLMTLKVRAWQLPQPWLIGSL